VYYISEILHEAKTRYLKVHKLFYAVLIASRKLRHYFQAHKISVMSSYPLRVVLHIPNAIDNIAKWAAELTEFDLDFVSRHAIKSHLLADFIVDWMPPASHPGGPDDSEPKPRALLGDQFKYMVHLDFKATNNMTEHEALLFGLSTTLSLGVRQPMKGDS
jgi:hypothetical protein